jgi:autotransporter-associated beta strand protein
MTVVTRPAGFDTDGDGMPDTWETAHGLNPSNAADRNLTNPLGYTMVEQYINELGANHATPTWNGNSGNWLTPTYWSTGAIPTNNDNAYVVGNGTGTNVLMTVTGTMAQCFSLHIGGNSGPSGDKVSVNGTLAVTDTIYVGDQNNGTLEINGGTTQAWNVQLGNTVGGTTYTGNLSLNGGTLKTCEVVLGGGTPGNWTSGGSCTWSGGTVQAIGALKFAVPATIGAGGAKIDSNGFACTVSGVLSGTGGLTKLGSGTLVLTAANTYTGNTIVSAGTLQLASGARLSSATAVNLSASGATLDMNGNSQTIASLTGVSGSALMLGGSALTVGGDATTTFSGAITSTGAGTLTKAGSGTLTLSASNAFTGAVNFNGGLINAASLNNLGSGSALNFNGGGLQFAAVYDPSARTMTFQSGGATLDTNGKNIVLANPIGNGGAGGLTKAGSGTLTLNAANTYTGDTIISGGTLELAPTGQIATASDINTSATTATLQIDSGTYTVGNISGVGNTILSAGGNLTVSSVVQNTLTIGDGATLTIAPIPGGPTAGMDLPVPVPEPSSIILLIAAAAGILFFVKKT